jgi:hypothetical protein
LFKIVKNNNLPLKSGVEYLAKMPKHFFLAQI